MQKDMTTVKLVGNTRYPTYQLYGKIINNKLDVEDRFKIVILETLKWLRSRFENIDVPDCIKAPDPEDYISFNLENLEKRVEIDEGYSLKILYLDKEKVWSMRLVEADLGLGIGKNGKGIPGRKFSTNIGFIINKNHIECGFKTLCIEPKDISVECDVFRLALVKSIVRNKNLGLNQVYPLKEEVFIINSIESILGFKKFVVNKKRQIPIVLSVGNLDIPLSSIEEKFLKRPGYTNLKSFTALEKGFGGLQGNTSTDRDDNTYPLNFKKEVIYKMSQGHFFFLDLNVLVDYNRLLKKEYRVGPGEVYIFYPLDFKEENLKYSRLRLRQNPKVVKNEIIKKIENYTKFKNIDYGNVKFYPQARALLESSIQNQTEDYKVIIESLKSQCSVQKEELWEEIGRQKNKIDDLVRERNIYRNRIYELEDMLRDRKHNIDEEVNKRIKNYEIRHKKLEKHIEWYKSLRERPDKLEEIPEWASKKFKGRMIFHQRAADEIRSTKNNVRVDIVCDSLDFLGHEYYYYLFGELKESEMNNICSEKYERPFNVGNSGDRSVEFYPVDYKIKYRIGHKGKPVETPLNMHLKIGNDNKNMIRIYFWIDKKNELIVIGSLPKHLPTLKF